MVNRIPLVLDVEDGNKIKELPASDNLNLSENNIVNVQDINALGTINAAIITVNGERLVAQNFLNLTDAPNTYVGSEDYFVKVNETGTGLEFRPIEDIGNLVIDSVTVSEKLEPSADNVIEVGTETNKIADVWAYGLRGSLVGYDGTLVFDAETNLISYAALAGAPQFLSEFQNDVGYLRTIDLDAQWQALFDGGRAIPGDLVGSVFSSDSVLMVDGLESKIRADIEFTTSTGFIEGDTIAILPNSTVDLGTTRLLSNMTPIDAQGGSIGTEEFPFNEAHFVSATIDDINSQQLELNNELGIGSLYGTTDLILDAGNRVKIEQGVPFKIGAFDSDTLDYTVAQPGDIVYNTQTNKFQLYQDTDGTMEWVSLHQGLFTGNIETTTGTSTLNDVVVAGNLTVNGTTTTVDTENTTISDNVIVLNNGEVGAGVTATTAGIEIDRGTETNKTFVWDDSVDKWTLGSETLVAGRFESVGVAASVIDNNGGPLQIKAGLVEETGNSIFINPYGSDSYIVTQAETYFIKTGPYLSTTDPYIEFTTAGAFKTYQGAYFDGNLTGDVTGSVFGDDSTILVDGVAGIITGNVENTEVITTTVQGRASAALNIYRGTDGTLSLGDDSSGSIYFDNNGINITSTGGVDINGAVGASVDIGTGGSTGDVTIGKVGNTTTIAGTFNATLTGDVTGNVTGDVTGDVTGNIDNTTLNIGTTTATDINIGHSGSTTTIDGTIQFTDALIANNLTADDSIVIRTEGNSANENITIFPQGTDTEINLRADAVNFIGPVASNIDAIGGVTGDITGSVFAQDSTLLVDALDGIIRGNIDTGASGTIDTGTLSVGTEIKTTRLTNLTPGITDLDVSFAGTVEIEAGTSNGAGTSNITLDKLGTSYITITSEPANPGSENALVSINTTAAAGDVQIGSVLSSRNQVVNIYNAEIDGTLTGSVDGTLTGSVVGSVFAEDSGVMVDAANYAMFADVMTLTPLNAEPASVTDGMMAIADGTSWNPLATGVQTLMIRLGGAWVSVAQAAA